MTNDAEGELADLRWHSERNARFGASGRPEQDEATPDPRPAVRYSDPRSWAYAKRSEFPATFENTAGDRWQVPACRLDRHDNRALLVPRDDGAGHQFRRPVVGDTAHVPDGRWPSTVAGLDWLDATPIGIEPSYYLIRLEPAARP